MANKSGRILVIEDNKDVLEGIMKLLDYCGYQPHGVTKFNEDLLEQIKDGEFKMIILDVMLSGMDGRDLVKRLKSTEEVDDVPILMTSAYHNIEDSVQEAGANGFLSKPFGLDDLRQKVEEYL